MVSRAPYSAFSPGALQRPLQILLPMLTSQNVLICDVLRSTDKRGDRMHRWTCGGKSLDLQVCIFFGERIISWDSKNLEFHIS